MASCSLSKQFQSDVYHLLLGPFASQGKQVCTVLLSPAYICSLAPPRVDSSHGDVCVLKSPKYKYGHTASTKPHWNTNTTIVFSPSSYWVCVSKHLLRRSFGKSPALVKLLGSGEFVLPRLVEFIKHDQWLPNE